MKKSFAIKIIVVVLLAFMAVWFITPSLCGVGSVGHIFGFFVCAAVITAIFVFPVLRKNKILRIVTDIITALFCGCCIYALVLSILMLSALTNVPTEENSSDTVIILGCLVKNGNPSPMLERRLQYGLEFLSANPDSVCVVSGGQGKNESLPEADAMKQWLVSNGIDESRVFTEDKSSDTEENISFSLKVIEANGLSKNIILISDSFHLWRASIIAHENGLDATCIGADTTLWVLPGYWVREWFGLSNDIFLK